MTYTYDDIAKKIREVTGRIETDQLSASDLQNYIENYYIYTMPNELKLQRTLQEYSFNTTSGTDEYDFPATFITVQPTAFVDGYRLRWYQDPDAFYKDYPRQYSLENFSSGDGITVTFSGSTRDTPIIKGSMIIYDEVETFTDNGDSTLTGSAGGAGTINYISGAYSVTFVVAPLSTAIVKAQYLAYQANRPEAILLFDNKFTLRNVPDDLYQIIMKGYLLPVAFTGTGTALEIQWGPLIIYGTALEIFTEAGEIEQYALYEPIYRRYEGVALDRTLQLDLNTRTEPLW